MTMTNEELLQKAVITTTDIAAQGKLNPQQANQFIDYIFDLSGLKGKARTVRFRNDQMEINKINVFQRAAVPAVEATDPGVRRGISTSKILIEPKEVMMTFEIGDDFLRENLEGQSVEQRIIRWMATRFVNDLELFYINGDALGAATLEDQILEGGSGSQYVKDSFLAMGDGWLRKFDSGNISDAAGDNDILQLMHEMMLKMPIKFRRNMRDMVWLMGLDTEQRFRYNLKDRQTALGDTAVAGGPNLRPLGVPMWAFPLWPSAPRVVEHLALPNGTPVNLRYTNVSNVVVTTSTLGSTPENAYAITTDYTEDLANGTITNTGTGAITNGQVVKVTYDSPVQMVLTHFSNLIIGMGLDVTLERDRDIFRRVDQFAMTAKIAVEVEEVEASVKGINLLNTTPTP